MRILIVGLPLFGERLKKDLEEFDSTNKYYFLDTYYNKWDKLKALFLIPIVDVVYSINGTLGKSKVFNLALFFKKRVMMTWVGTDVLKAKKAKNINLKFLNEIEHFCEVHWIQKELKNVNVDAEILNFFNFQENKTSVFLKNNRLQILSYISKGREEYYGWDVILEVAKKIPEVDFTIVGTDLQKGIPKNMKCLGWVDNMESYFNLCHATIRFLEHDGLSGFVLESLYRGKHVFYTESLNHCKHVKNAQDLFEGISELNEKLKKNDLNLNTEGIHYVKTNFNREFILNKLVETFNK